MDIKSLHSLYAKHVIPFLKYRIGGELSHHISNSVLKEELKGFKVEREAFTHLLQKTLEYKIGEEPVLKLVLEDRELAIFKKKFLTAFDHNETTGIDNSFDQVFDTLVAGYLEDILGKELVESVKKIFIKSVSSVPDQPMNIQFYIGMQAVYQFIPDVWGEVEFAEKVRDLSRLLPKKDEKAEPKPEDIVKFDDLLNKIIISDLVDILGKGHALETVLEEANKKTVGIFYNEHDRFISYVNHLLEDNFLTRMFDSYWINDKRRKWLEEVEVVLDIA